MIHPHRHPTLTALLAVASLAAVATASPAVVRSASRVASPQAQADRTITLITGQQFVESTGRNGKPQFTTLSRTAAMPLFVFETGGARYVAPAAAMHGMGAQLDPTLFQSEALQRAEAATPGQVPVQVNWHGAAPAMTWLLHPVNVAAGVTDGIVTAASGGALQAALAAGSLAGIDRISLRGAAPSAPHPTPDFPMYTLTVNGIDARGAPDTGDSAVFINTDDASKVPGPGFQFWYHGVFKVSVPNGHYALLGSFVRFSRTGTGEDRMVIMDFTVHGNTSVTVDARAATSRLSVSTPLPTDVGSGSVTWQRTSKLPTGGTAFSSLWGIGGGAGVFRVYVSPGPAPKFGTQGLVTSYHLDSSTSPAPYSFDLSFGNLGAISRMQRHRVNAAQLATVRTNYFSDVAGQASLEVRSSFFPGSSSVEESLIPSPPRSPGRSM